MAASSRKIAVPRPGETLRLWMLEKRLHWYQVHPLNCCQVAPHVDSHCPYCARVARGGRPVWAGYVLACLAGRRPQETVIMVPQALWDRSADLQGCDDYRESEWTYWRRPGPGAVYLTIRCEDFLPAWEGVLPEGRFGWEALLAWVVLAQDYPDYRTEVYAHWRPRAAPESAAPLLPRWEGEPCPTAIP